MVKDRNLQHIFTFVLSALPFNIMVKDRKMNGNGTSEKYPDLFMEYLPQFSSEKMLIPDAFITHLDGLRPGKAVLRSGVNKLWLVKFGIINNELFFYNGWKKFVKSNSVQRGDFLVFQYNGNNVFDVKLFGNSGIEKGVTSTSVSINNSSSHITEEEEEEEEEEEDDDNEEEDEDHENEDDDYDDFEEGEEEGDEEEEEAGVSGGANTVNKSRGQKKIGRNNHGGYTGMAAAKSKGKHKGTTPIKIEEVEVRKYVDPKNLYWVTKLRNTRKNSLYVPVDIMRNHNLTLPKQMIFLDEHGRNWPGKLSIWKDGWTWIEGWLKVCKWNHVTKSDTCICEYLQGRGQRGNVIKVHIVREGSRH